MRHVFRSFALLCLLLVSLGGTASTPGTAPAEPLLDGMTAVQSSLGALVPQLGDGTVAAVDFDATRGQWQIRFDRGPGLNPATLEIVLDEATGDVCARTPGAKPCFARGNVAALIEQVRVQRAAQEEAVQHPPPDLQGVMIALIRYQAAGKDGYLRANPMPLYVSLNWPDGRRPLDLSQDSIRRLADTGLAVFAGSTAPTPAKNAESNQAMVMGVGLPLRRKDGDYDVNYGFYCGMLCASWHVAVLHHDGKGWHVVSSHMNGIS